MGALREMADIRGRDRAELPSTLKYTEAIPWTRVASNSGRIPLIIYFEGETHFELRNTTENWYKATAYYSQL